MTPWRLVVLAVALAPLAGFPQDLPPEVLMLARLKSHMRQELARIPNYTCVEVLERFHKPAGPKGTMKPLDTMQLEVAHIGGRELFSWLGDRNFKEDNPSAFIGGGMIGGGLFAGHLQGLLVSDPATFRYRGAEDLDGRRSIRYDFQLSSLWSRYTIQVAGASGNVGMKGALWADPQSLDVLRLEIHADEIPPTLPIVDAITIVDYARMAVGNAVVLLPQTGDLRMIHFSGEENHDRIEFVQCRSFNTETNISFDPAPSPAQTPLQAGPAAALHDAEVSEAVPAGLLVSIVLTTPLNEQANVGQLIRGRVSGNVAHKGRIVIPNGAVVTGRVRRLERYSQPDDYFIVALEFSEIEAGASHLRFNADLQEMNRTPGGEQILSNSSRYSRDQQSLGAIVVTTTEHVGLPALPGVGSFFIRGVRFSLPTGFRMVWKTRALGR
jgi:hypothetical protein